jgi:hypothetical protein
MMIDMTNRAIEEAAGEILKKIEPVGKPHMTGQNGG